MKKIKLSGREAAVLRAIDFSTGTVGQEIHEKTRIEPEDLTDILNGLMDAGYVETDPPVEKIPADGYESVQFEVNPAYALELRETLKKQ
jgi:hypothetical protein